jgi:hypothetical protein
MAIGGGEGGQVGALPSTGCVLPSALRRCVSDVGHQGRGDVVMRWSILMVEQAGFGRSRAEKASREPLSRLLLHNKRDDLSG